MEPKPSGGSALDFGPSDPRQMLCRRRRRREPRADKSPDLYLDKTRDGPGVERVFGLSQVNISFPAGTPFKVHRAIDEVNETTYVHTIARETERHPQTRPRLVQSHARTHARTHRTTRSHTRKLEKKKDNQTTSLFETLF